MLISKTKTRRKTLNASFYPRVTSIPPIIAQLPPPTSKTPERISARREDVTTPNRHQSSNIITGHPSITTPAKTTPTSFPSKPSQTPKYPSIGIVRKYEQTPGLHSSKRPSSQASPSAPRATTPLSHLPAPILEPSKYAYHFTSNPTPVFSPLNPSAQRSVVQTPRGKTPDIAPQNSRPSTRLTARTSSSPVTRTIS